MDGQVKGAFSLDELLSQGALPLVNNIAGNVTFCCYMCIRIPEKNTTCVYSILLLNLESVGGSQYFWRED